MKNNEIALSPDKIYHIYNHANGKENLFENTDNYNYFLKRYQYFIEPIADTFAYCLMPNHLHLMVRIKDIAHLQAANKSFTLEKMGETVIVSELTEDSLSFFLSKTFGNLFSSYSQAFNKQQQRRGSLFMPNFKRKEIDSEKYYTQLVFYIHNNPVHHGFVKQMEDWAFSSYNAYIFDKSTRVFKQEVLDWFGSKTAFANFHAKGDDGINFDF